VSDREEDSQLGYDSAGLRRVFSLSQCQSWQEARQAASLVATTFRSKHAGSFLERELPHLLWLDTLALAPGNPRLIAHEPPASGPL
jgi:hypothetical protein